MSDLLIMRATLAVYPPASATMAQGLVTKRFESTTKEQGLKSLLQSEKALRTITNSIACFLLEPVDQRLEFDFLGLFAGLFLFGIKF